MSLKNRQQRFQMLKDDETVMVPHSGWIGWTENSFKDYYKNDFNKFQKDFFGTKEKADEFYDWGKENTWSDGSQIFKNTYEFFLQLFTCDLEWGKKTEACIKKAQNTGTGDWSKGTRKTKSKEWLEHFPCLKKYFDENSLVPIVDNQGYTYFVNKNPNDNKNYHFYSDGKIYTDTDQDTGKSWKCSTQRGQGAVIVEIYKTSSVLSEQIPFGPGTGGGSNAGGGGNTSGGGNTGGGTSSGWNEHCDGTDANPYKVGCKSANIGKAQGCLGSLYKGVIDDKFGKLTQAAIKQKLGKDTFTIEDLNRKICDIKFDDSDYSSNQNTSELP